MYDKKKKKKINNKNVETMVTNAQRSWSAAAAENVHTQLIYQNVYNPFVFRHNNSADFFPPFCVA